MATKIKDGVFLGDAEAAQDVDFLEANKVFAILVIVPHTFSNWTP